MAKLAFFFLLLTTLIETSHAQPISEQFERLKQTVSPTELYTFLYAMPKGGDLHNHSTGSNRSEWWYDEAIKQADNGYFYYTKVKINNCRPYGNNEYEGRPYLMLFVNLQELAYNKLSDCEKSEYKRLQDLTAEEKQGWLNSIRLDKPTEGRDEFFETHWERINYLMANPYMHANLIVKNMQKFGAEGLSYLETDAGVRGYLHPDGTPFDPEEIYQMYKQRFAEKDAVDTGVTVRLQYALVRFLPGAENALRWMYDFVHNHRDLYVAVDMVGREDNDKGHPLRFLPTLRELRHKYPEIKMSIHAGEVDEPNSHVKDTLVLGAERIGHGLNLITDPDSMLLMRNNTYMVEINLISNLLLEYVSDYSQHPFPEYLRTGIPVALSTDDRGMWDSNMTDEYYTAVTQFNLSWDELVKLGRNSLSYSFLDKTTKQQLLNKYDQRIADFEKQISKHGLKALDGVKPESYSYACKQFKVCNH